MNKIINIIKIPIIIILTFIIQILLANNFEIFGVTPNIILVTIVIVSMWNTLTINLFVAGIMGFFADLIFDFNLGKSLIVYLAISICISHISSNYRKESKTAIIYITILSTFMFEVFQYVCYVIDYGVILNIFALFKQIVVHILLNIAIAYIVYKIFEKSMRKDILNSVYR